MLDMKTLLQVTTWSIKRNCLEKNQGGRRRLWALFVICDAHHHLGCWPAAAWSRPVPRNSPPPTPIFRDEGRDDRLIGAFAWSDEVRVPALDHEAGAAIL